MTVTETPSQRAARLALRSAALRRRAVTAEQEVARLRALLDAHGIEHRPAAEGTAGATQ